jgi:sphingolipid delta-4 desaturase
MPAPWEAKLVGNSAIMKALWLFFFPVVQVLRVSRVKELQIFDFWSLLNLGIQVAFTAAVWYFIGGMAVLYMFLSFYFAISLHPLGGRWIQEHFVIEKDQETYSYYGGLNFMQMNIGYHNEHHDFPGVAWHNLPKIKQLAPEFYNTLYSHQSWTGLVLRFIFDKNISLYSRVERDLSEKVNIAPTTVIKDGVAMSTV